MELAPEKRFMDETTKSPHYSCYSVKKIERKLLQTVLPAITVMPFLTILPPTRHLSPEQKR
jgi:hypothetical protein